MATYRITGTRMLHEGRRSLLELTVERPDGGTMTREVMACPDAAAVLPYDPARRMAVLVRQFRAPLLQAGGSGDLLEAVAGLVDEGETPEAAIRREAMEEAGLRLEALEPVGVAWSTPGFATERIHLFLAPYGQADRTGEGGGLADEQEDIAVCEIPLAELVRMPERGTLADLKTLALVQALSIRRPELFETP